MTLLKNNEVTENTWRAVSDKDEISGEFSGEDSVIISLEHWTEEKENFAGRNGALGLHLESHEKPEAIADDVDQFDLISLDFPALPDGRAFSYARLLRERYGFKGELRAVGKVIQDQLFFMKRCGFDSFELSDGEDVEKSIAALSAFSVAYQPAADDIKPAYNARHVG